MTTFKADIVGGKALAEKSEPFRITREARKQTEADVISRDMRKSGGYKRLSVLL